MFVVHQKIIWTSPDGSLLTSLFVQTSICAHISYQKNYEIRNYELQTSGISGFSGFKPLYWFCKISCFLKFYCMFMIIKNILSTSLRFWGYKIFKKWYILFLFSNFKVFIYIWLAIGKSTFSPLYPDSSEIKNVFTEFSCLNLSPY